MPASAQSLWCRTQIWRCLLRPVKVGRQHSVDITRAAHRVRTCRCVCARRILCSGSACVAARPAARSGAVVAHVVQALAVRVDRKVRHELCAERALTKSAAFIQSKVLNRDSRLGERSAPLSSAKPKESARRTPPHCGRRSLRAHGCAVGDHPQRAPCNAEHCAELARPGSALSIDPASAHSRIA